MFERLTEIVKANGVRIVQVLAIVIIIVGLFIGTSVLFSYGSVGENEVAVETHWGEATGELYEDGLYFAGNPLYQGWTYSADHVSVEPTTMSEEVEALSADGQEISTVISVTYQLDGSEAVDFYSDSEQSAPFEDLDMWEEEIGERAVQSAAQDAAASVSTIEMLEAIAEDEDVEGAQDVELLRSELRDEVESQLNDENTRQSPEISINEVRVEPVDLSQELDSALENIATERAEAERQVIDAEADADAEIERAEGAQEAINALVEALGSEEAVLQYEWIEAIDNDDGTIVIDGEAAPIIDADSGDGDQFFED